MRMHKVTKYTTSLSTPPPPPIRCRSPALSLPKFVVSFCQLLSASVSLRRLLSVSADSVPFVSAALMRIFDEDLSSSCRESNGPECGIQQGPGGTKTARPRAAKRVAQSETESLLAVVVTTALSGE